MSQSLINTSAALLLLLGGVFVLRRLRMGALAGSLFLIISHIRTGNQDRLLPAAADAVIIWLELGLLIFGAYLFYNLLQRQRQTEAFNRQLGVGGKSLSVVLLFGWFLGSLTEGIAGFGIPAMLVAPLLYGLGFSGLTSVVIPLAANTASVTFGALATPLRIGMGITSLDDATVQYTVLVNAAPIMAMPFILAWLYGKTEQSAIAWKKERPTLLLAGVCFLIPYLIGSRLSMELPAILGGGIGMFAFAALAIPAAQRPSLRLWGQTFWPYLLFIALLIPAGLLLKPVAFEVLPDTKKISAFQPGIVFIVCGVLYLLITAKADAVPLFGQVLRQTTEKMRSALLGILLLVVFTQLIRADMAAAYGELAPQTSWIALLVFPGLSGIAGSFITGSATMGNLLFADGLKQILAGQQWLALSLAVLHSGSAVGNAVSLQNILMVKSVIADETDEARIMQLNVPVVGVYLLLVGLGARVLMSL